MNRIISLMAFALTAHIVNAQPQYCTISFTAKFQTSLATSTTVSPVYNNTTNQCTNWAVSVNFPSPIVNPTLSFTGSWDASGKPGTFAPLPPNCIAGGSLSSEVGGAPASMPVVNPMVFTGAGGWGDLVFNNCYFPYLQVSVSASSFPATGIFNAPSRASGSAGINPVAAVFAQPTPPSGGGGGGPTVQSCAAPWFGAPTSGRVVDSTYSNSTGKAIFVSIVNITLNAGGVLIGYADNNPGPGPTTIVSQYSNETGQTQAASIFFIVAPGFHYYVHTTGYNPNAGPNGGMWCEWN